MIKSELNSRMLKVREIRHVVILFVVCAIILLGLPILQGNLDWNKVFIPSIESNPDRFIFWMNRLPRVFTGFLVGGALALSGLLFQSILKNPLADPYILGLSAGAAFGKFVGGLILLNFTQTSIMLLNDLSPVLCFLGAILPMIILYFIIIKVSPMPSVVLLSGFMINIIFMSFIMLLQYFAEVHSVKQMQIWWFGSLDVLGYRNILFAIPIMLIIIVFIFAKSKVLNILSLDVESAINLGVSPKYYTNYFLCLGTILTAIAVSLAGPIAFIGLIVPQILRQFYGADNRKLVFLSFIYGGLFLTICDFVANNCLRLLGQVNATAQYLTIPVGVITSLVGAVFFLYLLIKQKDCNY